MPTTTFEIPEGPSDDQKASEAAALEQGEKILQMQDEDRARRMEQVSDEEISPELIGGKFKSQDDLLKAYEELQKKLGSEAPTEEPEQEVDAPEGGVEEQEAEEVEATEADAAVLRASKAYDETGELSEESIEELSKLDSKELIQAYFAQYKAQAEKAQQAQLAESEVASLKQLAGGEEAYGEMITWASQNLDADEIGAFNSATNSGNAAAARFAIESLKNRYTATEGYEAPLVTGRKSAPSVVGYRSNAELARDIADPRYHSDPAFRADVEAKLAKSSDLL